MRSFVLKVPGNLDLAGTAPLLCAGITVYSPLRHYGLDKPGMKIGVAGLGGLGHMVRRPPACGLYSHFMPIQLLSPTPPAKP